MIAYKEAFFDDFSSSLCTIMEYAEDGDLQEKIFAHQKKGAYFQEKEVWAIIVQMCRGIKALHDKKICHRDLKCANIFLGKTQTVKIGDLNVSKVAKKGLLHTQTGTPYYASPEVWKDKPYNQKADIWSLGAIIYEMVSLKPPFRANDMQGLMRRIVKGVYPPIPPCYSRDLENIIAWCLKVAPSQRPSVDELLSSPEILRHCVAIDDEEFKNELLLAQVQQEMLAEEGEDEFSGGLLNTIKVPRNLAMLGLRLPKPNYFDARCRERLDCSSLESLGGKSSFMQNAVVDRSFEREQGDQVRLPSISSRAPEPQSVKHDKLEKLEKISNLRGAVKRSADGRSAMNEAESKARSRRPPANNIPLPRYGAINPKYVTL